MGDDALRHNLAALAADLLEAARAYGEAGREREGAEASLGAVLTFLSAFPEAREAGLGVPLAKLAQALADLDRGHVQFILAPARRKGRPGQAIPWELLRGRAAAAVVLRERSGESPPEASAAVAEALHSAGFRRPGHGAKGHEITATTVQNWLKEARERPAGDLAVREFRKWTDPENVRDPALAADELLATLGLAAYELLTLAAQSREPEM